MERGSIGNSCRADRRGGIGDAALGSEVFDEVVGRGSHRSSMMLEFVCRATGRSRNRLESVNHSARAPGWAVEEEVALCKRLDM